MPCVRALGLLVLVVLPSIVAATVACRRGTAPSSAREAMAGPPAGAEDAAVAVTGPADAGVPADAPAADRVPVAGEASAAPADAAAAPVAAAEPRWNGDYCDADSDCAWNDECVPAACVSAAGVARAPGCEESAPPPGRCSCVGRRCTLRPDDPGRGASAEAGCTQDGDCAVDESTATCRVDRRATNAPLEREGPLCACDAASGRCVFRWIDPVPCRSWRDCSYQRDPRLHPVPSSETPRLHPGRFEPCRDGSVDSVCEEGEGGGFCRVVVFSC